MVRIKLYCNTGFANARHSEIIEIDDAEWAAKSEEERDKYLEDVAQDFMSNHIDYGAYVITDEDDG
jgi:hypothetical protein